MQSVTGLILVHKGRKTVWKANGVGCNQISLRDATFYFDYNKSERQVHAWCEGYFTDEIATEFKIRYNPPFFEGIGPRPGYGFLFAGVPIVTFFPDGSVSGVR